MLRTVVLLGLVAAAIGSAVLSGDGRDVFSAALDGDEAGVRAALDRLGGLAVLTIFAFALAHVVVPFPSELLTAAAGYALGVAVGLPVVLAAWMASALVLYLVAESAGRPMATKLVGARRLAGLERVLERGGWRALLVLRLIPLVPFNAICAAAGMARVPLARYSWTTLVGMTPLTTICVVLGSRLQSPRLDDPWLWGAIGGCLLAVALTPLARRRSPEPGTPSPPGASAT